MDIQISWLFNIFSNQVRIIPVLESGVVYIIIYFVFPHTPHARTHACLHLVFTQYNNTYIFFFTICDDTMYNTKSFPCSPIPCFIYLPTYLPTMI